MNLPVEPDSPIEAQLAKSNQTVAAPPCHRSYVRKARSRAIASRSAFKLISR